MFTLLFTLLFAVLVAVYYLVCCWSGCLHLGLLLLFFTPLFAFASVSGANTKRSNLVMIETKSHKFRGHDFNSNPLQPSSDSLTLLVETSLHIQFGSAALCEVQHWQEKWKHFIAAFSFIHTYFFFHCILVVLYRDALPDTQTGTIQAPA